MTEIVINSCRILDGTGRPSYEGSLLIKEGRIERIVPADQTNTVLTATTVIDGQGLTAMPGFIDTHSHNDVDALKDPVIAPKLLQGITTEILGQDGLSVAPVRKDPALWEEYLKGFYGGGLDLSAEVCSGTGAYLEALEKAGTCANYGYLVPHGNLRYCCMENPGEEADEKESHRMAELLAEEFRQGALGWSTGLIYPPCSAARQQEMEILAAVAAEADKPFVVHQRSESDDILSSMEELFQISEKTGMALHISHFKICGFKNMALLDKVLAMIDAAPSRGIRFSMDVYPYVAGSTAMSAMLPPWVKKGSPAQMLERLKEKDVRRQIRLDMETGIPGWDNFADFAGFDNIFVASAKTPQGEALVGKSLSELGELWNSFPSDALCDLLIQEENQVSLVDYYTEESVLEAFLKRPETNICTDGLLNGSSHPRTFGSFPRMISRFVREKGLLSMEEAVFKMTAKGARVFGIEDRGTLEPGKAADIVLADMEALEDRGTFSRPAAHPGGIAGIYVNGEPVVSAGQTADSRPGRILRNRNQ